MAVMNRFAAVAESLNQTQPWVISKYCFLSEGILFEQVSLLNTSFFLLPLANRAVSKVCPPPALPALVLPTFLPCWSLKLPLSFGSMKSKGLQCVVPQNHSSPSYHTAVAQMRCLLMSYLISNGKWLQCFSYWRASSLIVHDHLPIAGGPSEPPHKLEAEGQII